MGEQKLMVVRQDEYYNNDPNAIATHTKSLERMANSPENNRFQNLKGLSVRDAGEGACPLVFSRDLTQMQRHQSESNIPRSPTSSEKAVSFNSTSNQSAPVLKRKFSLNRKSLSTLFEGKVSVVKPPVGTVSSSGGLLESWANVKNDRLGKWKRRFLTVSSSELLFLKIPGDKPKDSCRLLGAAIRPRREKIKGHSHVLELLHPERVYLLSLDSERECTTWMENLQRVCTDLVEDAIGWTGKESESSSQAETEDYSGVVKSLSELACNLTCADCLDLVDTPWVNTTVGSFVCIQCSGAHRKIGVHLSRIRSILLDKWPEWSVVEFIKQRGNLEVNAVWEARLPLGFPKPTSASSADAREMYIRMKYEMRAFHRDTFIINVQQPAACVKGAILSLLSELPTELRADLADLTDPTSPATSRTPVSGATTPLAQDAPPAR